MDCETFFTLVEARLGDRWARPTRRTVSHQCVVDFFHPGIVDRFGDGGVAAAFNRSGVVWAPPARRLGVQLRVPAECDRAVAEALEAAPFPADRTDHRGASAPGGEMVSILHYAIRREGVDDDELAATLQAVSRALEA
ncbi:MAG: hypothetical protein ABEJ28_08840 [Salinigranum sp.]